MTDTPIPDEAIDRAAEVLWNEAEPDTRGGYLRVARAALAAAQPALTRAAVEEKDALIELLRAERVKLHIERDEARELLSSAAHDWANEGRGVMFNRAGDDLTPEQRVGKWLRDRAAALAVSDGDPTDTKNTP